MEPAKRHSVVTFAFLSLVTACAQIDLFQPIGDESAQSTDTTEETTEGSTESGEEVGTLVYSENFQSYALGQDPPNWEGTGPNNSLGPVNGLFYIIQQDTQALCATLNGNNIHAHLTSTNNWRDFIYSGRMINSGGGGGGVGVTFYSDYNSSDSYYRLRSSPSVAPGSFHFSHHPNGVLSCAGDADTDTILAADTWYRFKVRISQVANGINMKAKVWVDGAVSEPEQYQADCTELTTAYTGGRIGFWASGMGTKCIDDIQVHTLD